MTLKDWIRPALIVLGATLALTAAAFAGHWLLTPAPAATLTLPAEARGEPGDWIEVRATTPGKVIKWRAGPGLKLAPPSMIADSHVAVVVAPRAGTYEIRAWTAVHGLPTGDAVCKVVVGEGPAPGPGPTPPPGPEPADAFYQALKDAAAQETAADRAKLSDLAALYRQGAVAAQDAKLATFKMLRDVLHTARLSMIGEALPKVRAAVTRQLGRDLPTSASAPLDSAGRDLAARTFNKVADYLGRLPK